MSIALLFALALLPLFAFAAAICIAHDIRWQQRCAAANARTAAEREYRRAEAEARAEREAAIQAVAERNWETARRGGVSMIFEGIPARYRERRTIETTPRLCYNSASGTDRA